MAGAFVAIEGIDQAGKMTQALAIQERLRRHALGCEVRHYPDYATPIGRLIRSFLSEGVSFDVRVRCMLFAANRWEKDREMRALREAQALVLVDRYTWSNVVYGLSQGLDEAWLCGLETGILEPDATLLVDISPAESRRRKARGRDDYERDARLLGEARTHYLRVARERDWVVLNGEAPEAEVTARVLSELARRLSPHVPDVARALGSSS